jgi:hypothetical protein
MRTNAILFALGAIFYGAAAVAYAIWSHLSMGKVEVIGTAALGMLVFLASFISFYLAKSYRSQGPVPEDNPTANIEDADGEAGFFNAFSWWPLFVGMFASLVFASLAIGWWLFFIALPLALIATFGFVFENFRGQYAH